MIMFRPAFHFLLCLGAASAAHSQTFSQSGSATLGVRVVIATLCSAGAAPAGNAVSFGTLDFGTHPSLANVVKAQAGKGQAGIRVQCATGVPYRVVLGEGENNAGQQRRLKGPTGAFVGYALYSDASYSRLWKGATPLARSGTGAEELIPVYAAIEPAQATPAAGVYRDTVKVTIQW